MSTTRRTSPASRCDDQQFDPLQPLPASDNTLYIDWQHELMPYDDVKLRLVNAVARSGGAPVARLLTGHRGTGKTTELYRVQQMLMKGKKSHKVFVSFLECEEWLDLNDVSPQDLVLQMVRQLVNDLKKAGYGFGYEQFTDFLNQATGGRQVDKHGLSGSPSHAPLYASFSIAIGRLSTIWSTTKSLSRRASTSTTTPATTTSLIIVDQLDRIPQKHLGQATNHEDLFLKSARVLRALGCNVLYTIPIELSYTDRHAQLSDAVHGAKTTALSLCP